MVIKMSLKKIIISCSVITVLSGVSLPAYAGNPLGTLVGAAGGAVVGSNIGKGKGRIAAIAVGTLLGASLGSGINYGSAYASDYHPHYNHNYYGGYHNYHSHYRPYYNNYQTTYQVYNPPVYKTQVIQVNSYQPAPQAQAEYCREFTQNVQIDGLVQPGYGVACLQPDGSWKIQK